MNNRNEVSPKRPTNPSERPAEPFPLLASLKRKVGQPLKDRTLALALLTLEVSKYRKLYTSTQMPTLDSDSALGHELLAECLVVGARHGDGGAIRRVTAVDSYHRYHKARAELDALTDAVQALYTGGDCSGNKDEHLLWRFRWSPKKGFTAYLDDVRMGRWETTDRLMDFVRNRLKRGGQAEE